MANVETLTQPSPLAEPPAPSPEPPIAPEEEEEEEEEAEAAFTAQQPEKGNRESFIQPAVSFKEESNSVSDLSDSESAALRHLKTLLHEVISNQSPASPPPPPAKNAEDELREKGLKNDAASSQYPVEAFRRTPGVHGEIVSIWGIPLLKDSRSDAVLLKFLRAREFRVDEAFNMMKKTLEWRKEFGIDALAEEDAGANDDLRMMDDDFGKVVYSHGHDKSRHPVCYNVYGEFRNRELYDKAFGDEGKRERFMRWRIRFLERSVRKLEFWPGGVNTIVQVNDLKGAPGPGRTELRQATRQALLLLQDNYPEFVAKQVFVNVPWWYMAFYSMMSPFMTQRTKSKLVFTGPSRTSDTLFKYISPEQVPIQYGGLSVDNFDCNPEFTIDDPATEVRIKPTTKQIVEIVVSGRCVIVWELRVVGWQVTYGAEFIPSSKDGYTVIIQKAKKMQPVDDPVICSRYSISEPGKISLTIDNPSFYKRKLLYRYKVLPFPE